VELRGQFSTIDRNYAGMQNRLDTLAQSVNTVETKCNTTTKEIQNMKKEIQNLQKTTTNNGTTNESGKTGEQNNLEKSTTGIFITGIPALRQHLQLHPHTDPVGTVEELFYYIGNGCQIDRILIADSTYVHRSEAKAVIIYFRNAYHKTKASIAIKEYFSRKRLQETLVRDCFHPSMASEVKRLTKQGMSMKKSKAIDRFRVINRGGYPTLQAQYRGDRRLTDVQRMEEMEETEMAGAADNALATQPSILTGGNSQPVSKPTTTAQAAAQEQGDTITRNNPPGASSATGTAQQTVPAQRKQKKQTGGQRQRKDSSSDSGRSSPTSTRHGHRYRAPRGEYNYNRRTSPEAVAPRHSSTTTGAPHGNAPADHPNGRVDVRNRRQEEAMENPRRQAAYMEPHGGRRPQTSEPQGGARKKTTYQQNDYRKH
jgi:hypothetical protein